MVFEMKSDKTSIKLPSNADPGIKYLWFGAINSLTKWGVTRPTNPIIPQKATLIPTIVDEIKIIFLLRYSTFTPRLDASLSPNINISISVLNLYINKNGNIVKKDTKITINQSELSKPPIVQKVKLLSSKSDEILTKKPIIEPAIALIATPDKSMAITLVLPFTLDNE